MEAGDAFERLTTIQISVVAFSSSAISDLAPRFAVAMIRQSFHSDAAKQMPTPTPLSIEQAMSLAVALNRQGQFDQSISICQRVTEIDPGFADAHFVLADSLRKAVRREEAIAHYRRGIALRPDALGAYCDMARVLRQMGRLEESLEAFRQAIARNANWADAHDGLGVALRDAGQIDDAIAAHRRAVDLAPQISTYHSRLLYAMHYSPRFDSAAIRDEHHRWAEHHGNPLTAIAMSHANDRSPDRRLKIGYVSPDFKIHPVTLFLPSLLNNHDHAQFEVYCYSDVRFPDAMTARIQTFADHWIDARGMSDAALAERIRSDRIDILIDLTLHMASNRLLMIARKPAPVQITWLAYPSTSGLKAMDYRISDPWLDPPDQDINYTERTIRIPTYWCYQPFDNPPDVSPLPSAANGYITFGCLNNFAKVTVPTLELWADVLRRVDRSHLVILAKPGEHRQRTVQALVDRGIDAQRISFVGMLPHSEYLKQYHRIDIVLDTVPYNGHTTTLDALYMGVPVVTLRGPTAVGRGGVSILSQLGLPELIAQSPAEYASIAESLAAAGSRLSALRSDLRRRISESTLMNARQFTDSMEAAYRQAWRAWVER